MKNNSRDWFILGILLGGLVGMVVTVVVVWLDAQ